MSPHPRGTSEVLVLAGGAVLGAALVCVGLAVGHLGASSPAEPVGPSAAPKALARGGGEATALAVLEAPEASPADTEFTPPAPRLAPSAVVPPMAVVRAAAGAPLAAAARALLSVRPVSVVRAAPIVARFPAAAQKAKAASPSSERPARNLPDGLVAHLKRSSSRLPAGAVTRLLQSGASSLEGGKTSRALQSYAQALTLDPKSVDARVGLAVCRFDLGQGRQAEKALEQVLAADPNHPEAAILKGFIAQLGGHSTDAVVWYQRALTRLEDADAIAELREVIAVLQQAAPHASTSSATVTARAERAKP